MNTHNFLSYQLSKPNQNQGLKKRLKCMSEDQHSSINSHVRRYMLHQPPMNSFCPSRPCMLKFYLIDNIVQICSCIEHCTMCYAIWEHERSVWPNHIWRLCIAGTVTILHSTIAQPHSLDWANTVAGEESSQRGCPWFIPKEKVWEGFTRSRGWTHTIFVKTVLQTYTESWSKKEI